MKWAWTGTYSFAGTVAVGVLLSWQDMIDEWSSTKSSAAAQGLLRAARRLGGGGRVGAGSAGGC
jgi:hypothetical protein